MATIHELIQLISDETLRSRIIKEVSKLEKQKKFGLVYEHHLPECTPLYDVEITIGKIVALRKGKVSDKYIVKDIKGSKATCLPINIDKVHESAKASQFELNELVAVAQFGEPIYPTLKPIDQIINGSNTSLWHILIEADNYHALQLLEYLYPEKVDCIYIDPPYNSGAKDWKYNNDYVDTSDAYRHSKWLSMMEKRLIIAKRLLNPSRSVLIVTIDEKEYLRLGCLLEEVFPESEIQMITSVISGKGVSRDGQFSRVEEYIFILTFGSMSACQIESNMLTENEDLTSNKKAIDFLGFRRRNKKNIRTSRPNQFYPIFVDCKDGHIVEIGNKITPEVDRHSVVAPSGTIAMWPLDPFGDEFIWSVTPESARLLKDAGCLKCTVSGKNKDKYNLKYLASGTVKAIKNGEIIITERDKYGNIISGVFKDQEMATLRPRRVWNKATHNASTYGTLLLKKFLVEKRFEYPKSLYAVHDVLRFFLSDKPNSLVLDFFAGSGTTLHALNLLNAEDNGNRRCIMVTNNEVSADEAQGMADNGLTPNDEVWKNKGIARYVNWPRIVTSISGKDINGQKIDGDYLTTIKQASEINKKVVQWTFSDGACLTKNQKKEIVSLLGKDKMPQSVIEDDTKYVVSENYAVSILFDDTMLRDWLGELEELDNIEEIYIFTKDNRLFKQAKNKIGEILGPIIKESYALKPMSEGFNTNAEFFKLSFLDKGNVALGRQFKEILPILWMKSGAKGRRPEISEDIPDILILPENGFAVLVNEYEFLSFEEQVKMNKDKIKHVFIVTDSYKGYEEMSSQLLDFDCKQLYRDYLDNFRINK